jgi:regulator of ribonuclease activity A
MAGQRSICDLCDDYPDDVRIAAPLLRSYGGRVAFAGRATTVQCHEDNALLASVLDEPGTGRVLVVDGGGSLQRALVGGKIGGKAARNGWAGIVVQGAIRDVEELDQIAVGVLALGIAPRRPHRLGAGVRDVIAHVAGIVISPGDWVWADRNGLIAAARELV